MSIESLKAQARRHEQQDEWQKALDQYGKAIAQLAEADQPDIGLYNRVGDLYVRVGSYERALEHYERAVELYREAYLPNNAIAVCKKIVRHVPARHQVYLVMGQIRAEQGFIPDARTNFLTYAEIMQSEGDLDGSFRALVEFADLVPEEVDVRVTVADQMLANERTEDALAQLGIAYRILKQKGQDDRAFGLERRLMELDPDIDFDALLGDGAEPTTDDGGFAFERGAAVVEDDGASDFHDADALVDDDALDDALVLDSALMDEESDEAPGHVADEDDAPELPLVDETAGFEESDFGEDEGDAPELPLVDGTADFEEEDFGEDEGDAPELPLVEGTAEFDEDDEEDEEDDAPELPLVEGTAEFDEDAPDEDAGAELPFIAFGDEEDPEGDELVAVSRDEPGEFGLAVELDEASDRGLGIEDDETTAAASETLATDSEEAEGEPDAATEYVDLGSMIFGDEREEPKDTRFRVAYQEPTGDESADFQKMLSQFKEKVSENLDAGDVRAHHDLGTAYKEMGLLDEAISEFQAALRASSGHLPTYELMGQTFLEMGKHEAAVNSLERALKAGSTVEDELVGIYYYLARAYEQVGRNDSAVEFYDRVFSLDINFMDVTERLRALR